MHRYLPTDGTSTVRITVEIIVTAILAGLIWTVVLIDYYDLIGRVEFRRLCRPRPARLIVSSRTLPARTLVLPLIGQEMPCDGKGWITRDHLSNSGSGYTSRTRCASRSHSHHSEHISTAAESTELMPPAQVPDAVKDCVTFGECAHELHARA